MSFLNDPKGTHIGPGGGQGESGGFLLYPVSKFTLMKIYSDHEGSK